jgi:hypothetical protein
MALSKFNVENRSFRQVFGNGITYVVPRFQRDYAWGEEEWEDLWIDVGGPRGTVGEPLHYMGYLVLQSAGAKEFEVIDGQQRLTTISLLVLAAMRLLRSMIATGRDADSNQKRLDQLRTSYIGSLDPVTLTTRNKLSLNRNSDGYYRDYLVTLSDALPQRGFPGATQLMRRGVEWFERNLGLRVAEEADPGMALAHFIETMSDALLFTVVTVDDQLNAYTVFETLNARGVRLSATDLLKNYLFSVGAGGAVGAHELDELERRWERLLERLGSESFPEFLRVHWLSRHGFTRHSELFKAIRGRITTREGIFTLVRELDDDLDTYLALAQPEGSVWLPEWRSSLQELRVCGVRYPFPLLLTARRVLRDRDFGDLLRAVVVIAVRYNVIGAQYTGEQERIYHAAAIRLQQGAIRSLQDVLHELKPLYPADEVFRAACAEKSFKPSDGRNGKIVRYLLSKLEKQAGGIECDRDSAAYSIEHVLPQSPQGGWQDFPDRDLESFVYRFANMVMIESSKNREAGNQPYHLKRAVLNQSAFLLTRQLAAENDCWTPARVDARAKKLAAQATTVWRIAQLS